ncbi:MAG: CerR family C-terminal domain-containing protein [Candidatus Ancaeobacter aquaticus]|nr:CerR family C-terminal domain-containing protein [Candidatus Ancaeobacter aquaticus]
MTDNIDTKENTRLRVLKSACDIFAEKGYDNTTVQEICEKAGANVASVNYYFRNKETLYEETWNHAYTLANSAYPPFLEEEKDISPEKRLHTYINAMIRRTLDGGEASYFSKFMIKELAKPTPALKHIVEKILLPQTVYIEKIIKDLLGPKATDTQVRLCLMNIISPHVLFSCNTPIRNIIQSKQSPLLPDTKYLVEHIVTFVLAGINDLKKRIEENDHE